MSLAAFTVDVETDWGGRMRPATGGFDGLEHGLPLILDALDDAAVPATFFMAAELVETRPDLCRTVTERNPQHEIASHGFQHDCDYSSLTKKEFLYQAERSKDILESNADRTVRGFRSPQFRINPDQFQVLKQVGYAYDSSVVLGRLAGRYKNTADMVMQALAGGLDELPLSTLRYIRKPFGILWLNLVSTRPIDTYLRSNTVYPLVVYCHPFDFLKEKKRNRDHVPLLVKSWYGSRPVSPVSTMKSILHRLAGSARVETAQIAAVELRNRLKDKTGNTQPRSM